MLTTHLLQNMQRMIFFVFLGLIPGILSAADKKDETVLKLFHKENNPRNSDGSFCTLKNGDILFVYSHFYGKSYGDHAPSDLVARRSSDGGKTWNSTDEIIVRHSGINVMCASLLRLQDGRIALSYLQKKLENGALLCMPMITFSSDEAKTWSTPQPVCQVPSYTVVNNDRMIQLKSGRLIIPAAFHRFRNNTKTMDYRGIALFYISDNGGKTWRESKDLIFHPEKSVSGLQEPGVIELKNGNLLAWFRTLDGVQYKAYSPDGGDTWTPAYRAQEFLSPASPLSMERNPRSGELFAIWNDQNPRWNVNAIPAVRKRTPLVLAKSYDEGNTWKNHVVLESKPDHGYCYVAMHFTDDALLLAYCCGGGGAPCGRI